MPGQEYTALIGVALGWVLGEAGRWIWARREEKKAVAQALAALLEIRHRVRAIPTAVKWLSDCANLPPDAEAPLKLILSRWFPADQGLLRRYSDAVALVAAQNPILGFRLNHQDLILPLIDQLRDLACKDQSAGLLWSRIEPELVTTFGSRLDDLVRDLARQHSWITRYRIRRHLGREFEVPETLLLVLRDLPTLHPTEPRESGALGRSEASQA